MEKRLKHIELFAGCGGMSLGLEAAGFDLYFANELSPMAGETFAYNIFGETIEGNTSPQKTIWIKSQYKKEEIEFRLRENPFEASNGKESDLLKDIDLKDKLLIGDINELLVFFENNPDIVKTVRNEEIDLVSGGPPCQSFSLAGKREKNNHKNSLPLSFAKITGMIKPKMVLLENVKGITSPFTENKKKYHAWLEVAKAFALEGYIPVCMMLNSKYFGIAQNRPRYIMIAYREDIFKIIAENNQQKKDILDESLNFYVKVNDENTLLNQMTTKDLSYYDIELNSELFNGIIFPEITTKENQFISASKAINDLKKTNKEFKISNTKNSFSQELNNTFPKPDHNKNEIIKNHEPRHHSDEVMARFRFYQVISKFKNGLKKSATDLVKGELVDKEILDRLYREFSKRELYFINKDKPQYKKSESIMEFNALVDAIPSKKHSQRALLASEPAPAQLTIPDDLCHYDKQTLRTMTVREMARFQSFPDWFEFKSKVTTGGKMRRFEVPQYTQVGNAVPPLLAKILGETLSEQLKQSDNG